MAITNVYYKPKIWYDENDRRRVGDKAKWKAVKSMRKELRFFVKRYGVENAKQKQREMFNALVSKIRKKVEYTQTI